MLIILPIILSSSFGASSLLIDEKPDESASVSASAAVTPISEATLSAEIIKIIKLHRITLARTALLNKLKREVISYKLKIDSSIGKTTAKRKVITPELAARAIAKKYHQLTNTPELSFFKLSAPYSSEAGEPYSSAAASEIDAAIEHYKTLSEKAKTKLERLVAKTKTKDATEPAASIEEPAPAEEPEGIWWFVHTISLGYI